MPNFRLISRLDIKGPNLIKSIQFEGLRIIGDPNKYALKYYNENCDEIFIIDTVASLYGRNNLNHIINNAVKNIFVPITAGGGIRSVDNVQKLLNSGADKVAINTAAVNNPDLISKVANTFGSQCMVLSIEAKQITENEWEVYTENGRESTKIDPIEWAKEAVKLGAGEIIVTSVDRDGTLSGLDNNLIKKITDTVNVPVIASGGIGKINDINFLLENSDISGIAIGSSLHYNKIKIDELKKYIINYGYDIRI